MRVLILALLSAFYVSLSAPALASLSQSQDMIHTAPTTQLPQTLDRKIALSNLVSPSMQWSQLEMDSLKADGFNAGLPYAYNAEVAIKSDMIKSFNVAQVAQPQSQRFNTLRALTSLLIGMAGFAMWFGLALQRNR